MRSWGEDYHKQNIRDARISFWRKFSSENPLITGPPQPRPAMKNLNLLSPGMDQFWGEASEPPWKLMEIAPAFSGVCARTRDLPVQKSRKRLESFLEVMLGLMNGIIHHYPSSFHPTVPWLAGLKAMDMRTVADVFFWLNPRPYGAHASLIFSPQRHNNAVPVFLSISQRELLAWSIGKRGMVEAWFLFFLFKF